MYAARLCLWPGLARACIPATKVAQKELLPVVDSAGVAKPALLALLEELEDAGIERIALIIRPGTRDLYNRLFEPLEEANAAKLPRRLASYEQRLIALGKKIEFIEQEEQLGLGHAVWLSNNFAAGEPVLLCLGDHLYASNTEESCARQLIGCYEAYQKLTVSISEVSLEDVGLYGIVYGGWEDAKARQIMHVNRFEEKPSRERAREALGVFCRTKEKYFAFLGQYVITSEVYAELSRAIASGDTERGEFQLTTALEAVRRDRGAIGLRVDGRRFDIGVPQQYRRTVAEYGIR